MRALILFTLLPLCAAAKEKPVHVPKTPDDPAAQAAAKLLADRCREGEALAVFPPFGKQSWSGDWGRFSAMCTHTKTGRQRGFDFYAPKAPTSREQDFVFEGEGMTRAQLRRVLESAKPDLRAAARVVVFALESLSGNVLDGAGPEQGAEPPRLEGDVLLFQLADMRRFRVEMKGDGPVEASPR